MWVCMMLLSAIIAKQYVYYGDWLVPMKSDKSLMHVLIWESTQWDTDNLTQIIITSYQPWEPDSIGDKLEGKLILP